MDSFTSEKITDEFNANRVQRAYSLMRGPLNIMWAVTIGAAKVGCITIWTILK